MYLSINNIDVTSYLTQYAVDYKKIMGANSCVTLDGTTHEDILARKAVISATIKPIDSSDLATLADVCSNDSVTVTYTDIKTNAEKTTIMIPTMESATILLNYPSTIWGPGIQLTLEEK